MIFRNQIPLTSVLARQILIHQTCNQKYKSTEKHKEVVLTTLQSKLYRVQYLKFELLTKILPIYVEVSKKHLTSLGVEHKGLGLDGQGRERAIGREEHVCTGRAAVIYFRDQTLALNTSPFFQIG